MDHREQVLRELLEKNRTKFNIEFRGFRCNHMAHGLIALYKLNATEDRLKEYYDSYSSRMDLEPRLPCCQVQITQSNLNQYKGQRSNFPDLKAFFSEEIQNKLLKPTVNRYFPQLMEGLSGAAFHPTIHLGYSLELDDPDEGTAAEALAYMVYSFSSLGEVTQGSLENKDPLDILSRVQKDPFFDQISSTGFRNTMKLFHETDYQNHLKQYDLYFSDAPIPDLLALFSVTTVKVFLYTGCNDFFLLHGVTSMRALKKVLSILEDDTIKKQALQQFWRALVCVYITQRRRSFDFQPREIQNSWSEIIEKAISQEDTHVIKLAWACFSEEKENGPNPIYKQAAFLVHEREEWIF